MKPLDLSLIDSPALAAHVVVYRTLGLNKELAIASMSELLRRQQQGDSFDFDTFIQAEVAKVPRSQSNGTNLTALALQTLVSMKKNIGF